MNEIPTVSVFIPVFNGGRTLPRAIESVLAQTRPPCEILVFDDGSRDDSAAMARRYADRGVRGFEFDIGLFRRSIFVDMNALVRTSAARAIVCDSARFMRHPLLYLDLLWRNLP